MSETTPNATAMEQRLGKVQGYLEADPANPHLLAEAIDLCLDLGRRDEAKTYADRALAHFPDDPHFRFRLSNVLIADGQYEAAEQQLVELMQAGIDAPAVSYNLAYARFRLGRFEKARALLAEQVEHPDAVPMARKLLVRCLHHLGDAASALVQAETELATHPEDGEAMALASLLYLDHGDFEAAAKWSSEGLRRKPNSLEALVTAGSVALQHEDAPDARQLFERALTVNAHDGRAWAGIALTSLFGHDVDSAIRAFQNAVAYMPTHLGSRIALGWCYLMSGDLDSAEAVFRAALEQNRNFAESHGGLAVIAALRGQTDEARQAAERAARLDPKSLSAHYAQAILSGQVRDVASFKQFADRLLRRQTAPGGGSVADMLARMVSKAKGNP